MNEKQKNALMELCERFHVDFVPDKYYPRFDLPSGYIAGWVGPIYVGVSEDGVVSS